MNPIARLFAHLAAWCGAAAFLVSAWAQPQATLTPLGRWPELPPSGYAMVKVVDGYAYVSSLAMQSGLRNTYLTVLSLADPVRPVPVAYCAMPVEPALGWITGVEVSGRYAFVTGTGDAPSPGNPSLTRFTLLYVVDVADPAKPVLVASLRVAAWVFRIHLSGNLLYLAASDRGLIIIDLADPLQPRQIAQLPTSNRAWCVRVVGNLAYVGEGTGNSEHNDAYLEIIDVSSPTAPFARGGCGTSGHYIEALDVAGGYAYAGLQYEGGLEVIDVRDPAAPFVVASVDPADKVGGVHAGGTIVYTAGTQGHGIHGFKVIDVSEPNAPVVLGSSNEGAVASQLVSIELAGRYAYVSCSTELLVFDVSNPSAPSLAGGFNYRVDVSEIVVQSSHAYLSDLSEGGIRVLDVSNAAQPREVGRYATALRGWSDYQDVHVAGDRALLLGNDYWVLLDFAVPAAPVLLHHQPTSLRNTHAKIVGDLAYLLQFYQDDVNPGHTELKIVSLANPASPTTLGTCVLTNQYPRDVDVAGRYAYIADGDTGLVVVDVGSPASPRLVATVPAHNSCAVQVVGHYAYLGRQYVWDDDAQGYHSRLQIIDVADPLHPAKVGIYNTEIGMSRLNDLHVDGTRACLGFYVEQPESPPVGEIRVLDISSPANPVVIASCRTKGPVSMVQAVGDRIYAAEGDWGMSIYELSLPGPLKLNAPVLSGTTLTLSWTGGAGIKLQKTTSLTNPTWQDVAGSDGVSSLELPREGAAAFFRLIQP